MSVDDVLVECNASGVMTITLNRPARKNAMLPTMWAQLRHALDTAERDPTVRLVVLRGAGHDFCSGADVKKPLGGSGPGDLSYEELLDAVKACVLRLHGLDRPTVAAVDGAAVGGGFNLALACDIVIATDRARFSQIFVHRGLAVDTGGSWLLQRAVGLARAKQLVLSAATITAADAARLGIVHEVVAPELLSAAVEETVSVVLRGSPAALSASKRLLNDAVERDLEGALDAEARTQLELVARPEFMDRMRSFVKKADRPDASGTTSK
jgi:2-(1,2-epoxy-1,2-dihydrophenyl)acetyl-CoA isomerase